MTYDLRPTTYDLWPMTREEVALEMADVMIYLERMADRCGVNLNEAVQCKLLINEKKYPPIEAGRKFKKER